ncbi:MAG: hypothetical protein P4L33_04805 [Capsulimonadaceae bacterium]|nr:hypothetical protein [Capsulimonadaceae bacterium]
MKRKIDKFDDELAGEYDDVELIADEDYDRPPDDEAAERIPVSASALRTVLLSIVASCLMLLFVAYRTGRGLFGHSPAESIFVIKWLIVADLPIIMLGARALVASRPYEGTPLRGVAIAASAVSFIVPMFLVNSLWVLLNLDNAVPQFFRR